MTKNEMDRRTVLTGAAASAMALGLPTPVMARPGPEWIALHAGLAEAMTRYRTARLAKREARRRIMAAVRAAGGDIGVYFNAPEVCATARARQDAQWAAQKIFMPLAGNDAEAAMQDEALRLYETELGGDLEGMRERFPPKRHLA